MNTEAGGFFGKQFDQVAFVVDDLDRAKMRFSELYGIKVWNVWPNLADGQINKVYRGRPGDYQFSCAYGFVGSVMVELCQHDGGRSIYKDWLDSRGPGFHHLGFRLENREAYDEAGAYFVKQGSPLAMGGEIKDTGVWAYYDTVDKLGCYTEIYWSAPHVLKIFERMKNGEIIDLVR